MKKPRNYVAKKLREDPQFKPRMTPKKPKGMFEQFHPDSYLKDFSSPRNRAVNKILFVKGPYDDWD